MFMGLGMPIPDLSNKPGPGRPGWGPIGSYDFQFRVEGTEAVVIKANAAAGGSFTVQWPNGTTQVLSGDNASITAPDATDGIVSINNENDTDYCDDFAVVGGKDVVREVISWGRNAWSSMALAFDSCANLTSISETVFTAAAGCNMRSMLNNCDSLTIAKIKNWNLSAGIDAYEGLIRNCDNLEELDATGLVIKFSSASGGRTMFGNNGNSVANGCLFKMSGMDFSSTTVNLTGSNSTINMFSSCKFADGSDLSNWNFPATWNGTGFFNSSKLVGTNAVLNISNWDNYPGTSLTFGSMNDSMGDTGAKINLTNLNLSNFNNMSQMFYFTDLSQIIGVSTWNATAGNVNAYRAFWGSNFLSVTPTDNFSNAFIQSLTPTNVQQMFASFGNDNENVAVNLNGLDLSNITNFSQFMSGAKFSTAPDFSNVTFPSTAISWYQAFYSFDLPDAATSIIDFSTVTAKISNLQATFSGAGVNGIKFGNNIDFSQLTSFDNTFYSPSRFLDPQFPTNANFGAVTTFYRMFYGNGNSRFSTCQTDNFIRRLYATAFSNNGNVPLNNSQITEAPSVVRTLEAELVANGWTITENSTDATLPFAYPAYMVDSSSTTSLTPSTLPPVADRNFSSTNASMTIDQTTGVLSWASDFEGFTTVRCTYADGCYNEVNVGVQVPTVLRRLIPAGGQTVSFNLRGSQYVDWGDGTAENNSGNASHTYSAAGTGWGTWRTIKIFDKSATEKFTGFNGTSTPNYDRIDIMQWGSQVFDNLSFDQFTALGLRAPSNNPVNTTLLTSFYRMFRMDTNYKANARFADPNNNLGSWKTSTATGGGAITSIEEMFGGVSMLGLSILDDHSDLTWSFPAGTTATAGTYTGTIYGRKQSGTYIDYSIRWLVKVEGSGTVTLDNNNFKAIPNYQYMGRELSVGDVIRIDANSFGSLNNAITLTLTSDNILNVNENPSNLNGWDTSQITNFSLLFSRSSRTGGTRRLNMNFSNWNLSSAETFSSWIGGFSGNIAGLLSGVNDLSPKLVSAADSPTGSSYVAWDTSNVTNFSYFSYFGSNPLGVLRYWKFNTNNNVNMVGFALKTSLPSYASDEPCKTQVISASDANNPYGVDYTAWNMEKVSSIANFARYDGVNLPSIEALTPAFNSWQITDVLTSFNVISYAYSGNYTYTPNVGHWDISGLLGSNLWQSHRSGSFKFSTSAYDNLLDITNGWGSQAANVQSGVTLNMGTSKFTGNNVVVGTATVNGTGTNLIASSSPFSSSMVGGIVTLTSGTNNGEQAKITNFNNSSSVTISRSINLPAEQNTFTVDTTDAAKGRFALSDPDGPAWIITDGGKEIVFDPFKIQVRVPNGGLSFSFAKIMSPSNVNATINWGDGQSSTISAVNSIPTHTYTNSTGSDVVYEIELNQGSDSVPCTGFRFDDNLDATSRAAVENITQWGSTSWVSMASAFKTCSNLDVTATDGPIITNSTNLTHTFGSCTSLVNSNGSIGNWDVSQLTGMYVTFDSCTNFNVDISKWDTSSLGNLQNTFQNCTSFNQDLSTKYITAGSSPTGSAYWAWNTSGVSNMVATFKGTTNFNCGSNANGLSNWNTSSATSMYEMFENSGYNRPLNTNLVPAASSYSGSDYVAWDVDNVSDFREMFRDNTSFNQDISKWKFKSTGTIAFNYMLKGATAFAQDISTKTITAGNSPYGTQYTAWDISRASSLTRVIAGTNVNVLLNWNVGQWSQYALHSWGGATASGGGLSSANYTDQIVKWANDVNAAGKSPTGIYAIVNSDGAVVPAYDSTRTYGSGFANAGRARSYLSLDVSVSGLTGYNGTYYYDYATGQYVNESDSTLKFVYNTGESVWELHNEEGAQYAGTGGSQANGPTSATWSGFTVADASAGWSFNGTVTT